MESQTNSSETKQITIDVPAERLAEFYAFFSRFLAGGPGRGRRGRHGHGPHGHHGHPGHRGRHCGPHRSETDEPTETQTTGPAPAATTSV
jgi:hypothetical protein